MWLPWFPCSGSAAGVVPFQGGIRKAAPPATRAAKLLAAAAKEALAEEKDRISWVLNQWEM